jgi:predicted membrane protein
MHDGDFVGVCLKRINDVLVTRHLIGEIKCVVPFSLF